MHSHFEKSSLRSRIAESRGRLYRVALAWCGDEMLADDLVQETMQSGIVNRRQLRDEDRLFAWLYSILNHSWHRYLKQSRAMAILDDDLMSDVPGPLGYFHELETVDRVRCAVAKLPVGQRQVISLVDLEELTYGEVAEALGIPLGTVMSRLHRARKSLLLILEKRTLQQKSTENSIRLVK